MADLSILIPSRNEMFLAKTIENILENIKGDTEIISVLDGAMADPPVPDHPRVKLIYNPVSIGQRAATNQAVKLSNAKYIMKCDAHCSFAKGFDVAMKNEMHNDWTMVPLMKNLHAFDWVCPEGHRRYQGPSGVCTVCGKETKRDILWKAKDSPKSVSYCFDSTPHFQYFGDFAKRPEGQGEITETMSLQGSCFMLTREKYWELDICDESFGSWGSQGIEVAVKTWLSGGRVMVNKKTWYAHMFRTQGGDFSFPYPISGKDQQKARDYAKNLFFDNRWEKQIHPLSWLVERFWPVKGWSEEDLKKLKENTFRFSGKTIDIAKPVESEPTEELAKSGIVYMAKTLSKEIIYYTDNLLKLKIARTVQKRLKKISEEKNIPIVSSSLKPMPHFGKNIHIKGMERGYMAYFTQIYEALKTSSADIVFFCEHDVLYPSCHFDFTPPRDDIFYYNHNWWRLRLSDGFAVHWDANQVSGLCVYRNHALKHYENKLEEIKINGYRNNMGFEPGRRNTKLTSAWKSEIPLVDIKHGGNLSKNRWKLSDFHDPSTAKNFTTSPEIPGWGKGVDLVADFK